MAESIPELSYRLPAAATRQRALAGAALGFGRSLAPVVVAVVLLRRLGWGTPPVFWAVAAGLVALVATRAIVVYGRARRRLGSLVVTVTDETIAVRTMREGYSIERGQVARMLEVPGPLGGMLVESTPDAGSGVVLVAQVPKGGHTYSAVRQRLERWRPICRQARRGPVRRIAVFGVVVASIFFVPFFLDDFVAHSKLLGVAMVAGLLALLRSTVRG